MDDMSTKQLPLTLIVAATSKNGIGKNGTLPWPMLKKEMAYFARVTKRVPMPSNTGSLQSDSWKQANLEGTRRNVVIMGRKTWDSIPPKFRPLKDRINVVITTQSRDQLKDVPKDVIVSSSIVSGLAALESRVQDGNALSVGRAFIIGGSSIYEAALDLPQTKTVLLTHIQKEYECDTFFPVNVDAADSGWQRAGHGTLQEFVGETVPPEPITETSSNDETAYQFRLYERQ